MKTNSIVPLVRSVSLVCALSMGFAGASSAQSFSSGASGGAPNGQAKSGAATAAAVGRQAAFSFTTQQQLTAADREKISRFFQGIQQKLPAAILKRLIYDRSSDGFTFDQSTFKPIQIEFTQFQGQAAQINKPVCEVVDTFEKADQLKKEIRQFIKSNAVGDRIRYDGQLHVVVANSGPQSNNGTSQKSGNGFGQSAAGQRARILVHAGFLSIILNGEAAAEAFPCGHRNLYRLAEASVVHGVGRALDGQRFFSRLEESHLDKRKGACGPVYEYPNLGNEKERINWSTEALYCVDLMESKTLISERNRYRILGGGWAADDGQYTASKQAFWPRSVNRMAYSYDAQTHFAYHFEQFILDPTFACRLPNLQEYLVSTLSLPNESADAHQAIQKGICQINTRVRVADDFTDEEGQPFFDISWYDLNPNNVESIDYYRAGAGQAAASLFGHSMYRVRGKNGTALVDQCPDMADENGIGPCDLVINHRANPTELRMDQAKGFFGGYPSQLLVTPAYDIMYEYGDGELRHIYNLPLGQTNNGRFEKMPEDEKRRFLNASVEQFWSYIGNYKFVSNNCADEAMRLYQNASQNPKAGYLNILTPKQVDQTVFKKLGAVDEKVLKNSTEPGLVKSFMRKIFGRSQKSYLNERKKIEKNPLVDMSKRYSYYDALSEILRLEGRKAKDGRTIDHKNINTITDEAKIWQKLGQVSKDAKDICKINDTYATVEAKKAKVKETLDSVFARYEALLAQAKAAYQANQNNETRTRLKEVYDSFFVAFYHAEIARHQDLGSIAVSIAYEIAFPNNGKDMLCKGERAWNVAPERKAEIVKVLERYEEFEAMTQPYLNFSVTAGYGIPLKSEIRPDELMEKFALAKRGQVGMMMLFLSPELGIDYDVYRGIRKKRYEICKDRVGQGLYDGDAGDCELYFEDVLNLAKK